MNRNSAVVSPVPMTAAIGITSGYALLAQPIGGKHAAAPDYALTQEATEEF